MAEENPVYKLSIADYVDVIRELKSNLEEVIQKEVTGFCKSTGMKVVNINLSCIERTTSGVFPKKTLDVVYLVSVDVGV